MIRDNADFSPVDYEDVMSQNNKSKGLDLKNVIAFLGEHGADENTIRMVEAQCSGNETEKSGKNTSIEKTSQKRKQSKPAAETSAHPGPKTAKRKKAAASTTTKAPNPSPSKQSVPVTATA